MQEQLERFRRAAAAREGLRYSEELRDLARQYARSRDGGREQSARELGVSVRTLARWLGVGAAAAEGALCEVMVAESGRGRLVVTSPSGWRIEGLSVSEAAELLAALA